MAFSATIKLDNGRTVTGAYCRATILRFSKEQGLIQISVWESVQAREQFYDPLGQQTICIQSPDLDLEAANPIQYAYSLLEHTGQFPDATWNV